MSSSNSDYIRIYIVNMVQVLRGATAVDDLILSIVIVLVVVIMFSPYIIVSVGVFVRNMLGLRRDEKLPVWYLIATILVTIPLLYLLLHGI